MLKLKNVSKFYYSNGVISSGFTKINLELRLGEFVAITGESGSGKSTLLNVISGLDTYEEGEMYVNGEETSAYSSQDFENYRRKYIANIYQSFNLINSYTVAQNVEMVLLLSGLKKKERKERVKDILEKVDLYKYRNTKASRLSGGQKQRVAIARALVKDTPIIVADEPTGNLDTASAASIIELLSKLAKDRLVVVVTHNYEQVENYVTRKITMHDGRITEDIYLKDFEQAEDKPEISETSVEDHLSKDPSVQTKKSNKKKDDDEKPARHHLKFGARFKLGFRNAFNIVPKFLLLLFIFIFVSVSVTSLYSNLRESDFNSSLDGYNYYFNNTDTKRIIIKKADGSAITESDYAELEKLTNVSKIVREDLLLDSVAYLQSYDKYSSSDIDTDVYLSCYMQSLSDASFNENDLAYGRLPQKSNEIILELNSGSYYADEYEINNILNATLYLDVDGSNISDNIRVVGVIFTDSNDWNNNIYCSDELLKDSSSAMLFYYATVETTIGKETIVFEKYGMEAGKIEPLEGIARGEMMVPEEYKYLEYGEEKVDITTAKVNLKSLFFSKNESFKITSYYTVVDFEKKTGVSYDEWSYGALYINPDDYYEFFAVENYQSSVFADETVNVDKLATKLTEMGYKTLAMKDSLFSWSASYAVVEEIFTNVWSGALLIVLFFVAYFIIKLIMKSRNVYFATARMLGATANDCKSLIRIDLMVVLNLAFILVLGAIYAASQGLFTMDLTTTILKYFTFKDYAILYLGLNLMAALIAGRYSRKLFKSSALNVYKEA